MKATSATGASSGADGRTMLGSFYRTAHVPGRALYVIHTARPEFFRFL